MTTKYPVSNITLPVEKELYRRFKTIARAKDMKIHVAVGEALTDWSKRHRSVLTELLNCQ